MDIVKKAISFLPANSAVVIVTYPMSIEESEYDSQAGTLALGTILCDEEWKNIAIVAEEVSHAYQDMEGYWAMRLCQWRILPGIFQFLVERDAKKRAHKLIAAKGELSFFDEYVNVPAYYNETLKEYRKKAFGI